MSDSLSDEVSIGEGVNDLPRLCPFGAEWRTRLAKLRVDEVEMARKGPGSPVLAPRPAHPVVDPEPVQVEESKWLRRAQGAPKPVERVWGATQPRTSVARDPTRLTWGKVCFRSPAPWRNGGPIRRGYTLLACR